MSKRLYNDDDGIGCFTVIFGTIGVILVFVIGYFIYGRHFDKKYGNSINLPIVAREDVFTYYNEKSPQTSMICNHYSGLIDGHDYMLIYAYGGSPISGQLMHDPECKKCKGEGL